MTMDFAQDYVEPISDVPFELDEDVEKLMAEIALSAAARGCGEAAKPIFDVLGMIKPDNPIAVIGRALGEISDGRAGEAVAGLRALSMNEADCPDEVQAIMLLALCLAGHQADAATLCRRLLNGGSGPSRQIALRLKPVIDQGLPAQNGS